MINFSPALTMTLRCVIASCIACSLLILPNFASAQDEVETLDQGSGSKVTSGSDSKVTSGSGSKVMSEPEDEEPTIVISPGASPAVDQGAATEPSSTESPKTATADGTAEAELTLEQRRAAWMAELKQLTFKQLIKRIRDDERQINRLYINMPMSIPKQQLLFERRIRSLQGEITVLHELLEPAAVEAFRSNPLESQAATDKIFEVLASKLAPRGRQSKYDPEGGLRLVNTILEIKGSDVGVDPDVTPTPEEEPFMRIIYQGYLASYWLQDFETAGAFLARLENLNIGLDPKLRENFEATVDAWKIEESIRADEARADDLPRVKLETTDGDVIIELFENEAPNTVANFIKLVKQGYYDGLEFFHVVPSNYARSGCTANDGTTNPGHRIRNEFENGRSHFAGTVVMQNDGENTAGAQYIILHRPDPNLTGKVVSFGRVIEGLDIVYGFKAVNRIRNPGGDATIVTKAVVLRDRGHEYEPEVIEDVSGLLGKDAREVMSGGSSTRGSSLKGSSTRGSSIPGSSIPGSSTRGSSSSSLPKSGSSTRGSSSSLPKSGSSTRGSSNR